MSIPLSENTTPTQALAEPIQCPRCHTRYELSVGDLEAADGWVRCGPCEQVFFAPACLSRSMAQSGFMEPNQPSPIEQLRASHGISLGSNTELEKDPIESSKPLISHEALTANTVSPQAGQKAFFYPLVIGAFLLLLLSLGSFELYRMRHVMAAMWPELKPTLLALCQPLACTIEAPHDLLALSIENSALDPEAEQSHHFILSVKLRNHNSYPVAVPKLKLLMLNEQEEVVLQEEFDLAQLSGKPTLEPGVITPWRLPVQVKESIADKLATGYRVELIDKP